MIPKCRQASYKQIIYLKCKFRHSFKYVAGEVQKKEKSLPVKKRKEENTLIFLSP